MKVYLKYTFIFDPGEIWQSHEGFNNELGKYFDTKGYQAQLVQSGIDNPTELIVYLEKKPEVVIRTQPTTPLPEKPVKKAFADLTRGRDFTGKFRKDNT